MSFNNNFAEQSKFLVFSLTEVRGSGLSQTLSVFARNHLRIWLLQLCLWHSMNIPLQGTLALHSRVSSRFESIGSQFERAECRCPR